MITSKTFKKLNQIQLPFLLKLTITHVSFLSYENKLQIETLYKAYYFCHQNYGISIRCSSNNFWNTITATCRLCFNFLSICLRNKLVSKYNAKINHKQKHESSCQKKNILKEAVLNKAVQARTVYKVQLFTHLHLLS